MIIPKLSWTSSDNKIHTNYKTFCKHELVLMFMRKSDNDAIAKKIVESFTTHETVDEMVLMLMSLRQELPEKLEQTPPALKSVGN